MANDWRMKGAYLKTCNCAAGCPCDFWAPPTHYFCEAIIAMKIDDGHFGPTSLTGLTWAGVARWSGPLHLGNGTMQAFVDAKANSAQRDALLTILSGKAGGPWFQVVASLVSTMHPPIFADIDFACDVKNRTGHCIVPGEIEVIGEPIRDVNGKDVKASITLPEGIEYFISEIGLAKTLKSTGAIKFNHSGTHGGFSYVEHTPTGLK
jgi:hypothetical protein